MAGEILCKECGSNFRDFEKEKWLENGGAPGNCIICFSDKIVDLTEPTEKEVENNDE